MTEMEKRSNRSDGASPVSSNSSSNDSSKAKAPFILPKPTFPPKSPPAQVASPPSINQEVERKKNELVQAMLVKIRRFVTNQGGLLPDADISSYAVVMREEATPTGKGPSDSDPAIIFMKKSLLLTVLLNTNNGIPYFNNNSSNDHNSTTGYQRLCENGDFMQVLNEWLVDAVKKGSPLLLKLLDLFGVLPLSVEHLVEYRTGRLIKKLAKGEEPRSEALNATQLQEIRSKAERLFERWSTMALQHDNKQQQEQTEQPLEDKRKRALSVTSDSQPEPEEEPKYAQRIAQIVERAATSGQKETPTGRPMSADDIHKAKKKKMYLDMLASSSNNNPTEAVEEVNHHQEENEQLVQMIDEVIPVEENKVLKVEMPEVKTEEEQKVLEEKVFGKSAPVSLSISQFLSAARLQQQSQPPGLQSLPGVTPQLTPTVRKNSIHRKSSLSSAPSTLKKKKRVSFPLSNSELVQVRIIERLESEDEQHGERHDLHAADRKEATFAFAQLQQNLQPEVPWTRPVAWQLPEDLRPGRASNTPEMQGQQARTSRTLSTGSGPLQHPLAVIPDDLLVSKTINIPLRDSANSPPLVRPVPVNVKRSVTTAAGVSNPPLDAKLLSLLQSGDLLKNLLKK